MRRFLVQKNTIQNDEAPPKRREKKAAPPKKLNQHLTNEIGGEHSTTQKEARFSFSFLQFSIFCLKLFPFFGEDLFFFFFCSAAFFTFHFSNLCSIKIVDFHQTKCSFNVFFGRGGSFLFECISFNMFWLFFLQNAIFVCVFMCRCVFSNEFFLIHLFSECANSSCAKANFNYHSISLL